MAFGPVNAGGGASGSTMEGIDAKIRAARLEARKALEEHKGANNPHGITTEGIGAVPATRKVNGKALDKDIALNPADVGAAAAGHSHTAADLSGVVPNTRKVNGKALNADITLSAADVGAAAGSHTHSFTSLSGAVFQAGTTAPANTGLLWIDTNSTTGGLKYHNGSAWVHVPVAYT